MIVSELITNVFILTGAIYWGYLMVVLIPRWLSKLKLFKNKERNDKN